MEAHLITAPGDGISPSLLLTLGQRLKGQYLFNVPEGFARFVLEHKVRPTSNLRAAFAMDLQALAGFGGVIMRLRGEGHGQVHVLGPQGTQALVTSLRHFIHWKHPAVLISELTEWESPVCYEDEHIAVAALWKPPLVPELWQAPAWLLGSTLQAQHSSSSSSSSESESESSSFVGESSADSGSGGRSSSKEEGEDSESSGGHGGGAGGGSEVGREGGSGCVEERQAGQAPGQGAAAAEADAAAAATKGGEQQAGQQEEQEAAASLSMFDELDQIFMRGAGHAGAGHAGRNPCTRSSVLERLRAGQQPRAPPGAAAAAAAPAAAVAAVNGPATAQRSKASSDSDGKANGAALTAAAGTGPARGQLAAAAAAAAGLPPRRRAAAASADAPATRASASAGAAGAGAAEARVYVVGGKPYRQLVGAAGISAWAHDKLSTRGRPGAELAPAGGRGAAPGPQAASVLGYLCHVKGTDQLLLVANVHSKGAVKQLHEHPAVERLRQQSARVAGAVLMVADAGLGRSAQLRRLLSVLPGQHIVMERPGAGCQDIGHLAAARTTAKLHLVSPTIFPLPASIAVACPAQPPKGIHDDVLAKHPPEASEVGAGGAGSAAAEVAVAVAEAEPAAAAAAGALEGQEQQGDGPGASLNGPQGQGSDDRDAAHCEPAAASPPCGAKQPRQQQRLRQQAATRTHNVRQLSRVCWGASAPPVAPPAAAAVTAAAAAAAAAATKAPAPGPSPAPLLRIEPAEVFAPEAAAGRGVEARPSGADPAAVWRELRESKGELPSKLEELAEVVVELGKLRVQPRAPPVANSVQPSLQQEQQQQRQQQAQALAVATGAGPQQAQQQAWLQAPPPAHPANGWHHAPMQRPPPAAAGTTPTQLYPQPLPGAPPPYYYPLQQQQQPQQQPVYLSGQLGMPPTPPQAYAPPPPAPPGMMWVLQPAPPQPFPEPAPPPGIPPPPQQRQQQYYATPAAPVSSGHRPPQPAVAPPVALAAAYPPAWPANGVAPPVPPPVPPPMPPPGHPGPQEQGAKAAGAKGSVLGKRPSAKHAQRAEQEEQGQQPSNKRAAADLRARLRRRHVSEGDTAGAPSATGRSSPPAPPGGPPAAAAAPGTAGAREAATAGRAGGGEQGCPGKVPGWAEGAPECLKALVAAGDGSQVVFLGTGSAEPSKYRGASAIHLRLDCGQGLLLDCGEGCLGQMGRLYGHTAAMRQVAALGCIWLSHRHADHMLGLLGVLAAYPHHLPPLLVVGPYSARDWLRESAPHLRLRYVFVHCQELNNPGHWARQQLAERLGLVQLESVPVWHCSDAFGVVVGHRAGWRMVYSGDTQPCDRLVKLGWGCTLLIHEATFEPCLADQAARKRHSTTSEALMVAQAMGAYRTILTHFSQRYPKFPEGLPAEGAAAASTAIAFDGMRVPLAALPLLPALRPAVEYVLASEEEGEEQREQGQQGQ